MDFSILNQFQSEIVTLSKQLPYNIQQLVEEIKLVVWSNSIAKESTLKNLDTAITFIDTLLHTEEFEHDHHLPFPRNKLDLLYSIVFKFHDEFCNLARENSKINSKTAFCLYKICNQLLKIYRQNEEFNYNVVYDILIITKKYVELNL